MYLERGSQELMEVPGVRATQPCPSCRSGGSWRGSCYIFLCKLRIPVSLVVLHKPNNSTSCNPHIFHIPSGSTKVWGQCSGQSNRCPVLPLRLWKQHQLTSRPKGKAPVRKLRLNTRFRSQALSLGVGGAFSPSDVEPGVGLSSHAEGISQWEAV